MDPVFLRKIQTNQNLSTQDKEVVRLIGQHLFDLGLKVHHLNDLGLKELIVKTHYRTTGNLGLQGIIVRLKVQLLTVDSRKTHYRTSGTNSETQGTTFN